MNRKLRGGGDKKSTESDASALERESADAGLLATHRQRAPRLRVRRRREVAPRRYAIDHEPDRVRRVAGPSVYPGDRAGQRIIDPANGVGRANDDADAFGHGRAASGKQGGRRDAPDLDGEDDAVADELRRERAVPARDRPRLGDAQIASHELHQGEE